MKLIYICTHQIHNLTPLFREIAKNKNLKFKVIYWQRISQEFHDPEFNTVINFGIDQFLGYDYKCLFDKEKKTYDISFFFKLKVFFKITFFLFKEDYDRVIVHGYSFPNLITLILTKLRNRKTIMRDISYNLGERNMFFKIFRSIYYKFANLFIDLFWPIHKLNEKFFLDFGADKKKFFFIDHCQGEYDYLISKNNNLVLNKSDFIRKYTLPSDKKFIFFAGRFIQRKNPLMLFKAFIEANLDNKWFLIMAGEGNQKKGISQIIEKNKITNVKLVDFQNQQSLINFFKHSEILVLPSQLGDTHGNIACEAAQFNCALLLSNMVGLHLECDDLNLGLTFKFDDKNELIKKLQVLTSDELMLNKYQKNALEFGKRKTPKNSATLIFESLGINN